MSHYKHFPVGLRWGKILQNKLYFWSLLGSQVVRVHSLFGVLASIALSFLLWANSPSKEIPLLIFLVVTIALILIIISLASALLVALKYQNPIPRIENVVNRRNEVICLLKSTKMFSHGIIVSFYYTDEHNFEQLICMGTVINIQENGMIQVKIEEEVDGHEDILTKLKNNDKQLIKKVAVKPTVPYQY